VQVVLHDLAMKEELLKANAELCGNGSTYLTADLSKEEEVEALNAVIAAVENGLGE